MDNLCPNCVPDSQGNHRSWCPYSKPTTILTSNGRKERNEMNCEEHKDLSGVTGCPFCWIEERERLQADNQRLREALRKITENDDYSGTRLAEIAEQALEREE